MWKKADTGNLKAFICRVKEAQDSTISQFFIPKFAHYY
jgi:hypothetical protein